MIGEVERLLDQRVEIDRPALARDPARVFEHALDDAVGALAVLGDLVEVAAQHLDDLVDRGALLLSGDRTSTSTAPPVVRSICAIHAAAAARSVRSSTSVSPPVLAVSASSAADRSQPNTRAPS